MRAENEFIQLHSQEAEQSVLGGLMLDNLSWDKVSDTLVPEQFFDRAHQLIARSLFAMLSDGKPADAVTMAEVLRAHGHDETTGGLAYLASLVQNTPSAANIRRYADIVVEKAVARSAIHITAEMVEQLQTPKGVKAAELVDRTAGALEMLTADKGAEEKTLDATELAKRCIANIDRRYSMPEGQMDGIPTGWADLDARLMGLQPGDLVIIAGRPGMGKTVMAMNIAEHVSRFVGPVFVFSQEMSETQLGDRQIASLAGISLDTIRSGRLEDDDWQRMTYYASLVQELRMYIDFRAALSPEQVRNKSRQLSRRHGRPSLIVIDYLQLMRGPNHGNGENRNHEMGYITGATKALAKELGCPVILLSQLSRNVEQRTNKRPLMADLRDSGSIEQDADIVLFPYRDEYYNPDSADAGTVEVGIGKFRQGEPKPVRLGWQGQYARMTNLQAGWRPTPTAPTRPHRGGFDE